LNRCTEVVALAEKRIGEKIDEAKRLGLLAKHGGRRRIKIANCCLEPTLADIGIPSWAVSRYAKLKAAVAAQNECALVVLAAERRIAEEIDAARERGELAPQGRPSKNAASCDVLPTLTDIGIPSWA
jgi:hypothetical protein